jgi:hypothetical protein
MNEHELGRRLAYLETRFNDVVDRIVRLERIEEHRHNQLRRIEAEVHNIGELTQKILRYLSSSAPRAPTLTAAFQTSGDSMNAILVATIPTSRQDGTALAATAIASITYQKVPAATPTATPTVLQTNANAGTGPAPTDLTFTDTSASSGDVYTCFVTDIAGNVGALSNAVTDTEVAPLSPPAAPTLAATFQ